MKKVFAVVLALVLTFSLASVALAAGKVGVAMPTQSLQRWNQDGDYMKSKLEAAGFEVDLQYANNEVATQVSQLENMILNGAQVLVVASIDGSALDTVLATAKEAGIPVIAYDRLLTDTQNVDFYTTFDNYKVGQIQGQYVIDRFDLSNEAVKGPFTIEFTAGSPDDNNAGLFFAGAFDLLKPYLDSGKLVCVSGQLDFQTVATPAWKSETSQARMDNILSAYYPDALTGGQKLDIALCSNDSTALGVTNSLVAAGFTKDNIPVITGQDCDVANTKNMIAGLQAMSVFKDTRTLAEQTVAMVSDLLSGKEPEVNAEYDNKVKMVASFNCTPVFADVNNYEALLIESGYYKAEDLAN
ncbi:MAG: sugar ABC transporter substrate-binding protein [Clostridiales bacterium]|nr:sugar ABC transporter substrate-binding protein [Clostridiales bacterium]